MPPVIDIDLPNGELYYRFTSTPQAAKARTARHDLVEPLGDAYAAN